MTQLNYLNAGLEPSDIKWRGMDTLPNLEADIFSNPWTPTDRGATEPRILVTDGERISPARWMPSRGWEPTLPLAGKIVAWAHASLPH
jgi:hypothetical protein